MESMSGNKRLSDSVKIGIFRWWFAGAVFFFIGFGTTIGQSSSFDLMFVLAIILGLGTAFVFNPIIYRVFDVKVSGRIINAEYFARPLLQRVLFDLFEVIKAFVIVALIWITYVALNMVINTAAGNSADTVSLPVEPILFATFYLCYFTLITAIGRGIRHLFGKKEIC